MQQQAVHVYRWVERMNRAAQDAPEHFPSTGYAVPEAGFLANDEIPATLLAALAVIAEDLVPETHAAAEVINGWLVVNPVEAGAKASRYLGQSCGKARFTVRDQTMVAGAQPYRFFVLQSVQDCYARCSADERIGIDELLQSCGLDELLDIKLARRLGQQDNLEVWV
jgi:hypothetical protein